jgi:hypothetical protein
MNKTLTTIFTCATLIGFHGVADANSMIKNKASGHVGGSIFQTLDKPGQTSEIFVGSVISFDGGVSGVSVEAHVAGNIVVSGATKLHVGSYIKR